MQAYKVSFKHHYKWQMFRCWVVVIAKTEEEALAQAHREFIAKMPGYAHYMDHKKLCNIKPEGGTCVEYDFIPLRQS
jgi:hypothetical protein